MNYEKGKKILVLMIAVCLLSMAGCVPEDSAEFCDDGSVGIVKRDEGLYLIDGKTGKGERIVQGEMTPYPDISGDGNKIAYCRKVEYVSLEEAIKVLPGYEQKWISKKIEELKPEKPGKKIEKIKVSQLWIAKRKNNDIEEQRCLVTSVRDIWRPRISPDGRYVAYLMNYIGDISGDSNKGDGIRYDLYLAAVDGTMPAGRVAEYIACGYCWNKAGTALIYLENEIKTEDMDEFSLGTLSKRELIDSEGGFRFKSGKNSEWSHECTGEVSELVGTLFYPWWKVQVGREDRLFFSAAELRLPARAIDDQLHNSIFCFDPVTGGISDVLPREVSVKLNQAIIGWYEISPDGRRILLPKEKHLFMVYEFGQSSAKMPLKETEAFGKENQWQFAPAWKGNDEICCLVSKESELLPREGDRKYEDNQLVLIDSQGKLLRVLSEIEPKADR